jgi:hypothetical protein
MADKPIVEDIDEDVNGDEVAVPVVAAPVERRPPRKPGPRGGGQPYRGPGRGGPAADDDGVAGVANGLVT